MSSASGPVIADDPESADPNLINGGGQPVTRTPGMSFMSHEQSFELIRGGWIDISLLGALEVGANGDLANFQVPGKITGSLGGAQDLAFCAKQVVVLMTHQDKHGNPKFVERVRLNLTAPGCVKRIICDIAVDRPHAGRRRPARDHAGMDARGGPDASRAPPHGPRRPGRDDAVDQQVIMVGSCRRRTGPRRR